MNQQYQAEVGLPWMPEEEELSYQNKDFSSLKQEANGLSFRRGLLEAILALTVIGLLAAFIPQHRVSTHVLFAAFFLLLFAIAVRYTRSVVYITGVLVALEYAFLIWQKSTPHPQFYTLDFLLEPFILLLANIFMADVLQHQRKKLLSTDQQYIQAQQALKRVNKLYERAIEQSVELERQLAEEVTPVTVLCQRIMQLWRKTEAERYETLLHLISEVVGAQSCTIYSLKTGELQQMAHHSDNGGKSTVRVSIADPVIQRVLQTRQVSTVREALQHGQSPAKNIIMAGPLLHTDVPVTVVVVVHALPFDKFTPGTLQLFGSLLQIASLVLESSRHSAATTTYDEIYQIVNEKTVLIEASPAPKQKKLSSLADEKTIHMSTAFSPVKDKKEQQLEGKTIQPVFTIQNKSSRHFQKAIKP